MIEVGDIVKVTYEGRFEDGEVFDSSDGEEELSPLSFTVGLGEVIRGFEDAVLGMDIGESKEFILRPKEAYGEKNPELIKEFSKEILPHDENVESGMVFNMVTPQGDLPVLIKEVGDVSVTLDLNHPLAGKKLVFKIDIIDFKKSN